MEGLNTARTFELPGWLPACVGVEAQQIYEEVDCEFEDRLITRLTSDPRMTKVWRVLYRPSSNRGQFKYPARALSVQKQCKRLLAKIKFRIVRPLPFFVPLIAMLKAWIACQFFPPLKLRSSKHHMLRPLGNCWNWLQRCVASE